MPHLNPDWFYLSDTGLPNIQLVLEKRPLNECNSSSTSNVECLQSKVGMWMI